MSTEPNDFSEHPQSQLGDYSSKSHKQSRKYWTVFFALLALFISMLGFSVVSLFSHPSASPPPINPTAVPVVTDLKSPPPMAAKGDVDFGPYMANLQRRIKRAWFPPKGEESKRVVVMFKVLNDGKLSNLKIDKSSGAKLADEAALRAVENASPFRPLPAGAPKDVDIQFTFDYNVFSGGQHENSRHF